MLVSKKDAVEKAREFLGGYQLADGSKLLLVDVRARDDGLHVTYMVFFMDIQDGRPSPGLEALARAYADAFHTFHPTFARIPLHTHYRPV